MAITLGNTKIGNKFTWTWSMPPGSNGTCPGESDDCRVHCYAKKGFLGCMPSATKEQNYEYSTSEHFTSWMILELRRVQAKLFRIHVVGDFYNAAYIKKWIAIVRACPSTRFYAYTRSWVIPALRPLLMQLAKLPNFRLWWSCDRSMPRPKPPKGVRLAYMQVEETDTPKYKVHLVFRVKALRKTVKKQLHGTMICPPENGVSTDVTCEKCQWCWTSGSADRAAIRAADYRISLPVIA